jgi:hypothetical protein
MYYIYKFQCNWGDEFDVFGFTVYSEDEHAEIQEFVAANGDEEITEWYFGSNEFFGYLPLAHFYKENYEIVEVESLEFVNLLTEVIVTKGEEAYGHFPDLRELLDK